MNIRIQYGTAVAVLPTAALTVMDRATKHDLKVLLTLCAEPALLSGESFGECVGNIAVRVGCTPAQIEASLSFWRGAGVLTLTEDESPSMAVQPAENPLPAVTAETPAEQTEGEGKVADAPVGKGEGETSLRAKPRPAAGLPHYTSAELADLLEARKEASEYLKECQTIWGKMFNVLEHNIILGLTDYLGLEWDYVLTLLAFSVGEQDKRGIKRSLRYVENTAFGLYDEGVTDLPALQEKLRRMEQMEEVEGQLRRMFGMGERALTPTEKKKFSAWLYEYKYGMDIITRAFEVTVDTKGSPNLKYMDAILANWNRDGLRTLGDIEAAEATFQARKADKNLKKAPDGEGSFNTDDFFAAAVRRSFGDDFDPDKQGA